MSPTFVSPSVNCSDPAVPRNGSIEPYQNTTKGAEISFMCNPGFVPAVRMTAVCEADGRWSPDPAAQVCTGKKDQGTLIPRSPYTFAVIGMVI